MQLNNTLSTYNLPNDDQANDRLNVLVLGATGTAGMATTRALLRAGHRVSCVIRTENARQQIESIAHSEHLRETIELLIADVTDPVSMKRDVFSKGPFDAIVSCLASRSGAPRDAWAIDYQANSLALDGAKTAGIRKMVMLSAICVQKPLLEFQRAKLAFEEELINSGLIYSIVRPTAFFKSLSGQVERVRRGKPFVVFGDGTLTACKPISDADLGSYIADCLINGELQNRILPIGGPGKAITAREQGEQLFRLTGRKPRFRQVPVALLDTIHAVLEQLGRVSPSCAAKAELARIGRYYATESMLLLNPETGQYDADATPSTGSETLYDFYAALLQGTESVELGEHAVFSKPRK